MRAVYTHRAHKLLKRSKCSFAEHSVAYLGHAMDPTKVEAVQQWPQPWALKVLRGFLGLTGYYRRLISNYGVIATH